jgi:hypothetical protein
MDYITDEGIPNSKNHGLAYGMHTSLSGIFLSHPPVQPTKFTMKLTHLFLSGIAMAAFCGAEAYAIAITPTSGVLNTSRWEGDETSQNQIDAVIDDIIGTPIGDFELYKDNVGGVEEGDLTDSYTTTYTGDPDAFEIVYNGGNFVGPTAYLLVKDGSNDPAWYLFDLTALGWNGTDTIEGSGFWQAPAKGGISHVTLYGVDTPEELVPDYGQTLALFGLSLIGISALRRKLKR